MTSYWAKYIRPLHERERLEGLSDEYMSILHGMYNAKQGVQSMAGLARHRIILAVDFCLSPKKRGQKALEINRIY